MPYFRKKPVVIEAVQWTGSNAEEVLSFALTHAVLRRKLGGETIPGVELVIETLEGAMTASPGDWIIKGVKGEFYPGEFYLCRPDIFDRTYEAVP